MKERIITGTITLPAKFSTMRTEFVTTNNERLRRDGQAWPKGTRRVNFAAGAKHKISNNCSCHIQLAAVRGLVKSCLVLFCFVLSCCVVSRFVSHQQFVICTCPARVLCAF